MVFFGKIKKKWRINQIGKLFYLTSDIPYNRLYIDLITVDSLFHPSTFFPGSRRFVIHQKNIKSQLQNFLSEFLIFLTIQKKNGGIFKSVKGGSCNFTWILIPRY